GALARQAEHAGTQFTMRSEDGPIVRGGRLPVKIADLPTGKYSVTAKRGDWEINDTVEVQRGKRALKAFAFVDAPVSVTSQPNGAQISVDGQPRGKTPLQLQLSARDHEIVAHLDGWADEQQKIGVQPAGDNPVAFVFANGSVKITSAPAGATVVSNGRELGQT